MSMRNIERNGGQNNQGITALKKLKPGFVPYYVTLSEQILLL